MDDNEKVKLLIDEKNRLSNSKVEMQKLTIKIVFIFITFLGISAGIIANNYGTIKLPQIIMFVLSQVEFFLGLILLSIGCYINIQGACIKAIEERINNFAQEKLLNWESEIIGEFITSPKGAFFWITTFLGIIILTAYIYLIIEVIKINIVNSFLVYILFAIEILITLILFVFTMLESKRVYNYNFENMNSKV